MCYDCEDEYEIDSGFSAYWNEMNKDKMYMIMQIGHYMYNKYGAGKE